MTITVSRSSLPSSLQFREIRLLILTLFPQYAQMEALEDLAVAEPDRVEIVKKARVTKLLRDSEKAVIGVEYEHDGEMIEELGTVILATGQFSESSAGARATADVRRSTGGYAADFSSNGLLNKYRPDLMHLPTTNGDHW